MIIDHPIVVVLPAICALACLLAWLYHASGED